MIVRYGLELRDACVLGMWVRPILVLAAEFRQRSGKETILGLLNSPWIGYVAIITHTHTHTYTYTKHIRYTLINIYIYKMYKKRKLGCATSGLTAPIPSYSLNELLDW